LKCKIYNKLEHQKLIVAMHEDNLISICQTNTTI